MTSSSPSHFYVIHFRYTTPNKFLFHLRPFVSPLDYPRGLASYRLLYLSGESNASGSPLLSRLDEKIPDDADAPPDDLMNIGLAKDVFLRLDEEPPPPPTEAEPLYLALDSDSGKKFRPPPTLPSPRLRKNGDFIFTPL